MNSESHDCISNGGLANQGEFHYSSRKFVGIVSFSP